MLGSLARCGCGALLVSGCPLTSDLFRIKLRVPHEVAGGLAALRAGLEALVVEVAQDPENIRQMDQKNQRLLNLIRHVSKATTAGINLMTNTSR